VQAGLVDGRGKLVGMVAEAKFEVAQELLIGSINEFLGHLAESQIGGGSQLVHQRLKARFTVFGDR
jgi:hypothetical protein